MNNFMNKTLLILLLLQNGVDSVYSFSSKPTSTAATARQKKTQIADSFVEDPILADMPSLEQIQQKISFTPPKQKSKNGINRQSSKDWLHNIASIPRSTVLQEILSPVLTITAWSTLISVVHRTFQLSQIQSMNKIAMNMCISTSMHSFLVSSLGLLLVFRTNSAYQRFVEGRKIWENILSTSRNLTRLLSLYEPQIGAERVTRIRNTLAAFPYLLRHHIRPNCLDCATTDVPSQYLLQIRNTHCDVLETRQEGDEVYKGLNQEPHFCTVDRRSMPWGLFAKTQLDICANASNRPLWSCDQMAREVVSIPYSETFTSRERLTLLGNIDKLSNAIGQCERIHQTTVPVNYARHALRSLTFWLVTLPFALVKDSGLLTGPVTGIIAWVLFGIYQIGHAIEDPFQKTLRLSILCNAIKNDVLGYPN